MRQFDFRFSFYQKQKTVCTLTHRRDNLDFDLINEILKL